MILCCKKIHFTVRKIQCSFSDATCSSRAKCFRDFRRVKNNTSTLKRALIFSSGKCERKARLKFEYGNSRLLATEHISHTSNIQTTKIKFVVN